MKSMSKLVHRELYTSLQECFLHTGAHTLNLMRIQFQIVIRHPKNLTSAETVTWGLYENLDLYTHYEYFYDIQQHYEILVVNLGINFVLRL